MRIWVAEMFNHQDIKTLRMYLEIKKNSQVDKTKEFLQIYCLNVTLVKFILWNAKSISTKSFFYYLGNLHV